MKKEEKLLLSIQYRLLEEQAIRKHIQDWLVFVRILFEPKKMCIDETKQELFSLTRCLKLLKSAGDKEDLTLHVSDDENEASFRLVAGNLLERHLLTKGLFKRNQKLILDYTEVQMKTKGLFGYLRSYDEYLHHNVDTPDKRLRFQTAEEISCLPKIIRPHGDLVIDCNQFPGYDIFYKGYCLTSCWRMYFSRYYHKVIPLAVIEDVQQVEQVRRIAPDVILVELYRDPFHWDRECNLHYQRMFRDQLGVDQLAWDNGIGILREPFIEYAYSDNMIQTVQYQNDRLQPTEKKAATHFVTRTFDLVRDQQQVKRVRGTLNAQAYFPWVDEQRMKMMNYLVLNPGYALDDGLQAYMFYIRNYLEIEIDPKDGRYHEYLVVLNIYLPDEHAQAIPYQQLKQEMADIKFSRLKKRRGERYFDLKKGKNHLRVNFLQASSMPQLENITGGSGG